MESQDNFRYYEDKYSAESLHVPPEFVDEFHYAAYHFSQAYRTLGRKCKILDLGGGTGEFTKKLHGMGFDVTCFDYSQSAIDKATALGVKTICADFVRYPFEPCYDLVLVRGFSCLNTDSAQLFEEMMVQAKRALSAKGIILYMGHTDLSGKWTKSNWYCFSPTELAQRFGSANFVLLMKPNYQTKLPHWINQLITRLLCLPGSEKLGRFVHVCARVS